MLLKKKILAALSLMTVSALLVAGCGGGDAKKDAAKPDAKGGEKVVLRYAENQVKDYPTTKAALKTGESLRKDSRRITIEVYDSAQLGDEKSVIEQIQFGGIDMARVSLSPLSEFDKSLNVLQLPYLYRDSAHMWKVLEGSIGQKLLKGMEGKGIVGLSWFDAGARNFYNSKKAINKIEDLAGLKIRVQESAMMMDMVKALGANPTPMAYGEVYSALQTGVIDGAENNWPSYESTSHYEVAKYFVLDEHNRVPEPQIISKKTWDKLSDADKKIIQDAALESAKVERQLWA